MPLFAKKHPATTTTTAGTTTTTTGTTSGTTYPPAGTRTTHDPNQVHRRPWHHPLIFSLLLILGIIQLGLTARIVYLINNNRLLFVDTVSARFKYALFCAVWTVVLSLVWLGLVLGTFFLRWMHHAGFLALTALFWLIAASLIESRVGDFNDATNICSRFIGGSNCSIIRAIRAFSWLLFILSLLSIVLVWVFRHKERKDIRHRSDPAMVQPAGTTPVTRTV